MKRANYYAAHRLARLGHLGTLAMTHSRNNFLWFLGEVHDPRFPRVGSDRHVMRERITHFGQRWGLRAMLVNFHRKRGWWNCDSKPLIRLWVEFKAVSNVGI